MVVRIPVHVAPQGYVRVETRLLPAVGETIAYDTREGRITLKVCEIRAGEEPLLITMISGAEPDHFGRPVGDGEAAMVPECPL